jgi:hypothetical protein
VRQFILYANSKFTTRIKKTFSKTIVQAFASLHWRYRMTNKERQPMPFSVRLCSDKAAFEVKMQHKISLNMADLERLLKSTKDNEIIINTPHILIFKTKGAEVTMSKNGRMLIKKIETEKEATEIANDVLRVLSPII